MEPNTLLRTYPGQASPLSSLTGWPMKPPKREDSKKAIWKHKGVLLKTLHRLDEEADYIKKGEKGETPMAIPMEVGDKPQMEAGAAVSQEDGDAPLLPTLPSNLTHKRTPSE